MCLMPCPPTRTHADMENVLKVTITKLYLPLFVRNLATKTNSWQQWYRSARPPWSSPTLQRGQWPSIRPPLDSRFNTTDSPTYRVKSVHYVFQLDKLDFKIGTFSDLGFSVVYNETD